jgi:hypothetical protein
MPTWEAGGVDQVYVYMVEDGRTGSWTAELAVLAPSPASAFRILRDAGLRKAQFHGSTRPSRTASPAEFEHGAFEPRRIARRALEDGGWEAWAPVPGGFSVNWRDSGDVQLHHPIGGSFRQTSDGR